MTRKSNNKKNKNNRKNNLKQLRKNMNNISLDSVITNNIIIHDVIDDIMEHHRHAIISLPKYNKKINFWRKYTQNNFFDVIAFAYRYYANSDTDFNDLMKHYIFPDPSTIPDTPKVCNRVTQDKMIYDICNIMKIDICIHKNIIKSIDQNINQKNQDHNSNCDVTNDIDINIDLNIDIDPIYSFCNSDPNNKSCYRFNLLRNKPNNYSLLVEGMDYDTIRSLVSYGYTIIEYINDYEPIDDNNKSTDKIDTSNIPNTPNSKYVNIQNNKKLNIVKQNIMHTDNNQDIKLEDSTDSIIDDVFKDEDIIYDKCINLHDNGFIKSINNDLNGMIDRKKQQTHDIMLLRDEDTHINMKITKCQEFINSIITNDDNHKNDTYIENIKIAIDNYISYMAQEQKRIYNEIVKKEAVQSIADDTITFMGKKIDIIRSNYVYTV